MITTLQEFLAPYYAYIKFVHVVSVMVWAFSTAVAYAFYLVPVFKAWRRHPEDIEIIRMRNWAMERFDDGVIYEHIAFPLLLISGIILFIAGGWNLGVGWLTLKLSMVLVIFIPIEVCDYYLAHIRYNKMKIRETGDEELYEHAIRLHWWFLVVSAPATVMYFFVIAFLAIAKPFY